ncbi:MAG TPA: hypothetical protein VKP69_09750, partial [Isosphaeraceae bacterium]|nr:hypothetical protein [Isosphaeraceae bacterium]
MPAPIYANIGLFGCNFLPFNKLENGYGRNIINLLKMGVWSIKGASKNYVQLSSGTRPNQVGEPVPKLEAVLGCPLSSTSALFR